MRLLPFLLLLTAPALGACHENTATAPETPEPPAAAHDLLFESTLEGGVSSVQLRVRDMQSGAITPLFGQSIPGASPSASADGSRIVYVGPRAGDDYDYQDLWLVVRGAAPQRIPLPGIGPEFAPALSPDGTRIAFVRLAPDNLARLYVADVSGANERQVMPNLAPASGWTYASPAWSPDGTRLLFSAGEPGALRLWITRPTGGSPQQVTEGGASDIDGAWAPDGRAIAFVRSRSPASNSLMTVDLLTGEERDFGYAWRNRFPAWSPDGQRIAFVSNMHDNADLELYTVRRDGTQLTQLTNDDVRQQSPRWLRR